MAIFEKVCIVAPALVTTLAPFTSMRILEESGTSCKCLHEFDELLYAGTIRSADLGIREVTLVTTKTVL